MQVDKHQAVLFIDDDPATIRSIVRGLNSLNTKYEKLSAHDAKTGKELLISNSPSVCILDLELNVEEGPESGFSLIHELLKIDPQLRIIVLTGHISEEYGIKSLNLGAVTFLTKPANSVHLNALIEDNLSTYGLKQKYKALADTPHSQIKGLKTQNPSMKKVLENIFFISTTSQPTLILGKTGVGKGIIAKAIHALSSRANGPFIRFQANNDQQDLIASELFGHTKGAFTGANYARIGLIEQANAGTLFIDEAGELPEKIQLMLLDVLQEKCFRQVGSNIDKHSNFRLITATNRTEEEVKQRLRKDFYHRITHFSLTLPELKDRVEDIPYLADEFLKQIAEKENLAVYHFSPSALSWLVNYDWPGNIRELEAFVEVAAARASYFKRSTIELDDLKTKKTLSLNSRKIEIQSTSFQNAVRKFKYNYIRNALDLNDNNQTKTAAALNIQRSTLCNILKTNKH